MSTWDRPFLRAGRGGVLSILRSRRTARNWASREASNMERMDSLSSSFMEVSFAWDKRQNAMLRSVCQYERNIDRLISGATTASTLLRSTGDQNKAGGKCRNSRGE